MAQKVLLSIGRAFHLKRSKTTVSTVSGKRIEILGVLEISIRGVGSVPFLVCESISHDCILGWDSLHLHGWAFSDQGGHMTLCWGHSSFRVHNEGSRLDPIIGSVEVGEPTFLSPSLKKYRKMFGLKGTLQMGDLPELHITTTCDEPLSQSPYRAALNKRAIIDSEVDKMLELGVITPSMSPWASPVTLVPKKDGTWRFCVDYRRLNSSTIKDKYPLPHVDDIFNAMHGCEYFSTLDMKSGFWQLPVHADSKAKTAFVCHRGQFEFNRMPFGLCNAPLRPCTSEP
jgi:hypothetical protein